MGRIVESIGRQWALLVANRLLLLAVFIWVLTFLVSLGAAWALVSIFGGRETMISLQGDLGPVTFSVQSQPQARAVTLGVIGVLGFAALIAMPTRLLWDEVSKAQEARRAFALARRDRMLQHKTEYYVPLYDRLEYLLGAVGQCQRALEEEETDIPYVRLLHALVLLQSTVVWAHNNGISFLFRNDAHRERVEARWQAHQQELLLNVFHDPVADLLLAESARKPDTVIPLEHEITSRLLVRTEYEYSEFRSLVTTQSADGSTARGLYHSVKALTLVQCRRLRILTAAWWKDLDQALRHLESDNSRDDVEFRELLPDSTVHFHRQDKTQLLVVVSAVRGADSPAARVKIDVGSKTIAGEVDRAGLFVKSLAVPVGAQTIAVTTGSSKWQSPIPP